MRRSKQPRTNERTHILFAPGTIHFGRGGVAVHPAATVVVIPTDLVLSAYRQAFPEERMLILGGRRTKHRVRVTSASDVTGPHASRAHVWADPKKLATALIDIQRTGAHFAAWLHSHPGTGPSATHPSQTDLTQEEELLRHYTDNLVCIIVTSDGCLRVWGAAINDGRANVRWQGQGITPYPGESNAYQLQLQ